MATKDTPRRQQSNNIKSAVVTAALVGTLGGWVAFGAHQAGTAADTSGVPVAQVNVAAQGDATAQNTTAPSGATAQDSTTTQSFPSTAPSSPRRHPAARSRSSR